MILRPSYWIWRFNLWRIAHLLPEWHRFYQAEIAALRKSHKATKAKVEAFKRRKNEALRQEVSR